MSSAIIVLPETATHELMTSFTVRATNQRPLAENETTKYEGGVLCGEYSGKPALKQYIKIDCKPDISYWEIRYVILQSSSYIELADFWVVTNKCLTKDGANKCIFPYISDTGKIKVISEDTNCPTAVAEDGTIAASAEFNEDKCPTHAKNGDNH